MAGEPLQIISKSRRRLLQAGLALPLLPACTVPSSDQLVAPGAQFTQHVGVQLFTVRHLMAADSAATLAALAGLGYREVEFAGYHGHNATQTKRMLADNGLKAPSTHVGLAQLSDTLEQTLETAATIGHRYVVLAYLTPAQRPDLDAYRKVAELLNHAAELGRQYDLHIGYHNHSFEFVPIAGVVPYNLLLADTEPELVKMTMDLYWVHKAAVDPLLYIAQHPGRFHQCHVKDMNSAGEIVDVGAGTINFANIFKHSAMAGFRHYYVEHDNPAEPLVSVTRSLAYLRGLKL